MKPLKTKAQIRAEIEEQIAAFIDKGGAVHDIPSGISGHTSNENWFGNMVRNAEPQTRTPLVEIIKQIDARKVRHKAPAPVVKAKRRPRRKLITDDFGEPVRWVWVEE